jgi:hypothetical protein
LTKCKKVLNLYYIILGVNFVEQEVIEFRSPNKLKGRKTHTTKDSTQKSLARNVLQRAQKTNKKKATTINPCHE